MSWKLFTMAAVVGLAGCSGGMMGSGSGGGKSASPSTGSSASTGMSSSGSSGAGGQCNADGVQSAVGKSLTQALLDQLRTQSGSGTARALKPGEMITMEYMPTRLNVLVDAKNTVTAVRCG